MKDTQPVKTILNAIGIKTANFTAATTDVITSNAHGLNNDDMVVLTTTDTLPAGLAVSTVYYVIDKTTNTFKLSASFRGAAVDITDTGTGTHTFTMHDIGYPADVTDYRHAVLTVDSDGGGDAAMTVKFQGSMADTPPDFSAAQSPSNQWDYIECIDLEDGSDIDGDTGIVFASADDHRQLEMNVNHLRWVNAIISGWSAGEVTVKIAVKE